VVGRRRYRWEGSEYKRCCQLSGYSVRKVAVHSTEDMGMQLVELRWSWGEIGNGVE
jgi:hypothetical protein